MQRLDDEHEWRMDDLDDELDQEATEDVDRGDGPIADGGSLVEACPECDSASIRARSPSTRGAIGRSERNYCGDCGASFDEPVVRPAKHPGVLRGLAKKLEEADADEVGRRVVTDGGSINWPANFERTPSGERVPNRDFKVSLAKAFIDLERSLDRIGVDDFDYEFDARQRQKDKRPYANASPDDPSFVVRWTKNGEQFAVACDRHTRLRDNVRMVGLYLEEKRKMEDRPVATGESEFANARLPPASEDDVVAAPRPAHEVLGVSPDAPEHVVRGAYRELTKERHPDHGGSQELMNELKEAKEAMLA